MPCLSIFPRSFWKCYRAWMSIFNSYFKEDDGMRRCSVCGKRVRCGEIPIKVTIRTSFFDKRKKWFHPDCFFENKQLTKELIAGRKKR